MHYTFIPQRVCSQQIDFDLEEGRIHGLRFTGGCNGNLKAIAALVEGQPALEVADKLAGITCGYKATSCSGQLAIALREACAAS